MIHRYTVLWYERNKYILCNERHGIITVHPGTTSCELSCTTFCTISYLCETNTISSFSYQYQLK